MSSHRARKVGQAPGTLVYAGERKRDRTRVTIIQYDEGRIDERLSTGGGDWPKPTTSPGVTWVDVDGLHQVDLLESLGADYGLHPLVLEDILTPDERAKLESYGDYLYVVLKVLVYDDRSHRVRSEQVSIVLGRGFVLSFQEGGIDVFEPIRDRLRSGGRIRAHGPDYLAYALLDVIVDNYFVVVEKLGDRIESLEDRLVRDPKAEQLGELQRMRRDLILLRRAVWPLREVVGSLQRTEPPLLAESTSVYLRDLYDHVIEVIDSIETLRETITGMHDIYLSSVSNRLNEVMRVLTVISTIFIPLTFIAGVYGMNFDAMPELHQPWGYPAALSLMLLVALMMLVYFRRRRWL